MKITIYELLGLVKDGKVPKKIKYDDKIWDYSNGDQDYYNLDETDNLFGHLFNDFVTNSFINNYVEIVEEPKKIEKIARCDSIKMTHYGELYKPTENEEILRIKINEIIDEINNLKEND